MLHLTRPPEARRQASVLIFGAGLIGGRVGAALGRRGWRRRQTPTPWDDAEALERHLASARQILSSEATASRLDILWSAGRAGFAAEPAQTLGEEASFRWVLELAAQLSRSGRAVVFHLISSAGGLYEGQRHVDTGSQPSPRRPYGELKLRLERRLAEVDAPLHRRVYRLASAFGPAPRGGRRGLIPTLLHNARVGRVTSIVGQLTTLRDYVWTEDIAQHLAAACCARIDDDRQVILASGKPTTIHEILHLIQRVTGRKPALAFAAQRDNATDITFAPSALPGGWIPTDLETTIRQLHRGVFAAVQNAAAGEAR